MKKTFLFVLSFFIMLSVLSGCGKNNELDETNNNNIYVTDINGELVPAHSDVNASVLDARKFVTDESGRVYYDEPSVTTYTGIDISVFQGDVDWNKVAADGIDFVMLRAGFRGYGTNGTLNEDESFRTNYEGATKAGLKVGVYFFSQATTAAEATEEAEFTLNIIKGMNISYPVAYDWEHIDYDTARTDGMTTQQISDCALAFCQRIELSEYRPLVYLNCETGYFSYDLTTLKNYHFWLAEYSGVPTFYYDYKIWQYTKNGTVNGINGAVDLNISMIDYSGSQSIG